MKQPADMKRPFNPSTVALKLDTSEASFGDWWLIEVDAKGQMVELLDQFHDEATARAESERFAREAELPLSIEDVPHLFPR